MDATAIKAMMAEIAPVIREYVGAETAPLKAELAELRERAATVPEKGDPGEKGDRGEPGKDVDMDAVLERIAAVTKEAAAEQIAALAATLPAPEKGEPGEKGEQGERGEPGPPGKVDMDAVGELIAKAVSALPPAEKGERGPPGEKGEPGMAGSDGKDGVGLADTLMNQDGELVLTMTDGRTKSLGVVKGKDGEPGAPGRDGLGFDDLKVEQVGDRTVRFILERGADQAEFDVTFPVPIYREIWSEKEQYEPGDLTTWAGSLWHCGEAKGLKPGDKDSGWKMAAKKGRDGKDAVQPKGNV